MFSISAKKITEVSILALLCTVSISTVNSNPVLAADLTTSSYPNSNSPLGINIAGVSDYTSQWPFVDVFKISRPWISQREDAPFGEGGSLNMTPEGWIASLEPGQSADTVMFDNGKGYYPGGQYVLLYDGKGTINFGFDSAKVVSQTDGRMVLDVVPQDTGIYLSIAATDPNDPIRDIRVIMPGFEDTYQTQPFHPLFLETLSQFKTLRFMDWLATNNSTVSNWSERPTLQSATQSNGKGVALEYLIDLANTLHADPWFNIPAQATDNYVQDFTTLVRDRLDPSLKAYVEYSNEVWNPSFSQYGYAREQGLALGLDTDGNAAALKYYSQRSVEVFKIWEDAFNGKDRLVRVLASQAANPATAEQVLSWKDAYKNADAYGIAPYFSGGDLNNPQNVDTTLNLSQDQIIDKLLEDIHTNVKQYETSNYDIASSYGLQLVAYEGGIDLTSYTIPEDKRPQVTALFADVNRNPRLKDVYVDYLNQWKEIGGGLFNQFVDVSGSGQYGTYGALEYQNQDPNTAPKYLGLLDFIKNNPTDKTIDSSNQPSSVANSTTASTVPVPEPGSGLDLLAYGLGLATFWGARSLIKRDRN